jgi:hypothetical protein
MSESKEPPLGFSFLPLNFFYKKRTAGSQLLQKHQIFMKRPAKNLRSETAGFYENFKKKN